METKEETYVSFCRSYLASRKDYLSNSTVRTYRNSLENHIAPYFKETKVVDISRQQVQTFVSSLKTSSKTTIVLLKMTLQELYIDERIHKDLANMIRKPKTITKPKPKQALTQSQLRALFEALKGTKRELLIRLMFATGIRIGETLSLHWLDFQWNPLGITSRHSPLGKQPVVAISICKTYDEHTKEIHRPKTPDSNRIVYLTEPYTIELLRNTPREHDLVFYSERNTDQPVRRETIKEALKTASRKAKLPFTVTPHHARLNYASYSLAKGISEKNLQAQLGHSNSILIHTVYGKAIGDRIEKLMEVPNVYA